MKFWPITLALLFSCSKQDFTYTKKISKAKIKICLIGDTGTNSPIQKKVAAQLKKENCDTLHFLGDIIYPKGINAVDDRDFFTKFYDHYKEIDPKYLIMGNHDHRSSIGVWLELAKKYPDIIYPHPYYLLKLNSLCMVHLDTNYYKLFLKFGKGIRQHLWLNDLASDMKDCSKKIVLAHHPYESRGKHHGTSSGLLRLFHKMNVIGKFDALISGHDHILSDEGMIEGTRMFISGAGGNPDKNEPAGYLVLWWDKINSSMEFHFRKIP